jgi:hypothetical protein
MEKNKRRNKYPGKMSESVYRRKEDTTRENE